VNKDFQKGDIAQLYIDT